MSILVSQLVVRSEAFKQSQAAMQSLLLDLRQRLAAAAEGGGEGARAKHLARGKLLPRDRVERLLDPGTPFLEIAPLAALGMYTEANGRDAAAAGHLAPLRHGAGDRPGEPSSLYLLGGLRGG